MAVNYVASGGQASGTGAITAALPAGIQTDDFLLLVVETANEAVTVNTGGWTAVSGSPQGTGTAGGTAATRLSVYYRIADGTETNVSIADSGNHQVASISSWSGVDPTAPINASAGSIGSTASTSLTFPSITTTADNCEILLIEAHALPDSNTNTQTTGHTNSNLSSISTKVEFNTSAGNGGGFSVASGLQSTAGSTGTSTASCGTSSTHGYITLALKPAPLATRTGDLAATETGNDSFSSTGSVLVQGSLDASETGEDTFAASGIVTDPAITGTLSVSETGIDTFEAAGLIIAVGNFNVTETGDDTLAATGTILVQGSADVTETGSDIFAASGGGGRTGTFIASESGNDTTSVSGQVFVTGSYEASETGSDTAEAVGFVIITGDLTAAEAGLDTFEAVQGQTPRQGDLSASEESDYFGLYVAPGYVEDGYFDIGVTGTLGRIGGMAAVESGGGTAFGTNAVMKYYNGIEWVTLLKDPTIYT